MTGAGPTGDRLPGWAGAALERRGTPGTPSGGGVLVAALHPGAVDAPWRLWLAAAGEDQSWLAVQVRSSHRLPRERWPSCLAACDTWNGRAPLTKAWLAVTDWEHATTGGLVVEGAIPVGRGGAAPPEDVIDRLIDRVAADGLAFWRSLLSGAPTD